MSVYIRGMEMPKCCFDCACYHHRADDGYYDYEICGASRTVFNDGYASVTGHKDHINPFKVRLDNCPLVPVPPHGRLIDADELRLVLWKRAKEFSNSEYGEGVKCGLADAREYIKIALTIIPAEEVEE